MLVITKSALTTYSTMIVMLVVDMMLLMPMTLTLEALVHVHLVVVVSRAAIEQAMVLPMVAVIVHAVRVMRW